MLAKPAARRCFVTTGSIASFRPLLEEILSDLFLQALEEHGFETLEVQCGPDHAWFESRVAGLRNPPPVTITALSFASPEDIRDKMLACRGQAGVRLAGVIIGHAGTSLPPPPPPSLGVLFLLPHLILFHLTVLSTDISPTFS